VAVLDIVRLEPRKVAMSKAKQKAIHYARAVITPCSETRTLQKIVDDTYSKLDTAAARQHVFKDGITIQTRFYAKRSRLYGSQVHIVAYTDKEPASIVPKAKAKQVDADLGEAKPPKNANYMDGEAFLLIRDSHILICAAGVGVSDKKISQFFEQLCIASGASSSTVSISVVRAADVNKLKLIAQRGVKALGLSASMDEAGLQHTMRTSVRETMIGSIVDDFKALVMKGNSDGDDAARAHLDAEVIITVDRFGRGEISQKKLNALAQLAIEVEEGVRIVLTDDTVITGAKIAAHKYFYIEHKFKAMFKADALDKLDTYHAELKADGYFN
jgi:hypothetical protein